MRATGRPLFGRIVFLRRDQVARLKKANIQHVTFSSRGDGMFVLVNGHALPFIAWDQTSMADLVRVLGWFQDDGKGAYLVKPQVYEALAVALPLIQKIGLRFDFRFPRDPSKPTIPLPDEAAFGLGLTAAEKRQEPLDTVDVEIQYRNLPANQGWVPSILGFSTLDLQTMGKPLDLKVPQLRLRDDVRRRFVAKAIRTIEVKARSDGLFFSVNGRQLPHLAWSEATLTTLTDLLTQLYPDGTTLPDNAHWVPVLRNTAPMLNDLSMGLLLKFPAK
jgi:hypothetical protein